MNTLYRRRTVLKAGGLALASLALGGPPRFLERLIGRAEAAAGRRKTLVCIFQRGAMDGLMAVPPLGDPGLKAFRPRLAMKTKHGVIDLGNGFGLHPGLDQLEPLYRDGLLAIVHGMGSPNPTRSHFDAQDYMESGTPFRKGTASGWLNRASGELESKATPFQNVSMTSTMPRSLYGDEPSLAISDLTRFHVEMGTVLESEYSETGNEILRDAGVSGFAAVRELQALDPAGYRPDAEYPRGELGDSLKQLAFLIKNDVGLEIGFCESGGWDTHVQQGTRQGTFAGRSRDLARSISAFWTDLGARRSDVVILTMTEFGRTVRENGSGGTDHGRGSCLFVLGEGVEGGRVHGSIPQLQEDALEDGRDLPVTTDFRSVFSAVAEAHLGIGDREVLFPGWDGTPLPLFPG